MKAVMEVELDGRDLKRMLEGAKLYLERHIDEVNSLNIFPVPDRDTGTNMFLTIRSATEAMKRVGSSAGLVAAAAARGALLGARGDSGVILAQILRGIAKGLEGRETFSFADFARALRIGSEQAYKIVDKPIEGTILTVIKEASKEASRAAEKKTSFTRAASIVILRAGETVRVAPQMHPVLKEAGVVDAGAKGLYYFFRGMGSAICRIPARTRLSKNLYGTMLTAKKEGRDYGFDVQFLLEGEDLPVDEIRNRVIASGECPLVIGDEKLLKIHVHTMNPDDMIDYARSKGIVNDIVIEDMDSQVQRISG